MKPAVPVAYLLCPLLATSSVADDYSERGPHTTAVYEAMNVSIEPGEKKRICIDRATKFKFHRLELKTRYPSDTDWQVEIFLNEDATAAADQIPREYLMFRLS